jgi:hypothetical protein
MFSRTAQLFAALCRACFIYPDKVTMLAFDSLNPEKSDREPSFFKNSCVRFIIDEEVDWGSSSKTVWWPTRPSSQALAPRAASEFT